MSPDKVHTETIVAAATASGGALSLIRISGPDAFAIADRVFRSAGKSAGADSGEISYELEDATSARSEAETIDCGAAGVANNAGDENKAIETPAFAKREVKTISSARGFSILYGDIVDEQGGVVDDVLVSVFRAPRSYTGENMVEISCHGSAYIVRSIVELLVRHGARAAGAGEFTTRAFLVGKIDLSQAEAVADMIASRDRATHTMALTQMRGGYSEELKRLRGELLRLASLLELELDFSEEDVEFADRSEMQAPATAIKGATESLAASFSLGNAIKKGIGVAIVGSPNVGKSTLLNALLNEERAMVSDIAGTTRDAIEENIVLDGVEYRFIDTAGIRESADRLEQMGIERTFRSVAKASVLLYLFDAGSFGAVADTSGSTDFPCPFGISDTSGHSDSLSRRSARSAAAVVSEAIERLAEKEPLPDNICIVINKCDSGDFPCTQKLSEAGYPVIPISAKYDINIYAIIDYLKSVVDKEALFRGDTVVSNTRHYEVLLRAGESLDALVRGIGQGISGDLLAQDIRQALYWLGTITGEITTTEILSEIFSKFCIGK